jgi:serine/threonine protein kinase
MSEEVDLGLRLPINHDFSGETVGQHYKLNRRIGLGGTASIYAATVTTTMAAAAVKVLHPEHNKPGDGPQVLAGGAARRPDPPPVSRARP